MGSFVIKGQGDPVVLQPVESWDQRAGYETEYVAYGTKDALTSTKSQLPLLGAKRYRIEPFQGATWKLSATFGVSEGNVPNAATPANPDAEIVVQYAFPRNDIQRDAWNHPRVEKQLRLMDPTYRARFRSDVESWMRGETEISYTDANGKDTVVKLSRPGLIAVASAYKADATEIGLFLDALSEGVESYIFSKQVLRVTFNGPTASSLKQARQNTNRVYARAKVIAELSPPQWVADKITDGFWLKHVAEEQQEGAKLSITQEWEFFGEIFATFFYGEALA